MYPHMNPRSRYIRSSHYQHRFWRSHYVSSSVDRRRSIVIATPTIEPEVLQVDQNNVPENFLKTELTTCKYKDRKTSVEQPKCPVCLENYEADDEICELKCHHVLHVKCGHTWLREKKSCPLCRYSLADNQLQQN